MVYGSIFFSIDGHVLNFGGGCRKRAVVVVYVVVELALVLVLLGYFTLLERKTLGYGQVRKGPNKGVLIGLVQPLLDGFKLFIKGFKGVNKGSMIVFFGTPGLGL